MPIALFRRSRFWLPTLWGWLFIFALLGGAGVLVFDNIHAFLATNQPAPGAKLLVVEGWMTKRELDSSILIAKRGNYGRVLTTGGPANQWVGVASTSSFAEVSADYLRSHGLDDIEVVAVPAPATAQERTYISAVKVREWLRASGIGDVKAFDLVSAGTHARRSHRLYRMAFGSSVNIGIVSVRPSEYDDTYWWQSSEGAKSVLDETIGLLWTVCCFHPPAHGSPEELWGSSRQPPS